jgi:hypothetical protein
MDGKVFKGHVGSPQVTHIRAICPCHILPASVFCQESFGRFPIITSIVPEFRESSKNKEESRRSKLQYIITKIM